MDDSICRGKTQPQELWNRIKKDSGYTEADIDFLPFWIRHFKPNVQVHQLVADISKNHAIGLMTNIYPGVYPIAIETGNIPRPPYAFVLQSFETGFVKPEKEIYSLAEKMSGQKPYDILLIDDNLKFITQAQERGWKTFTFNSNNPNTSVAMLRSGFNI